MRLKLKVGLYFFLEDVFGNLSEFFGKARERFAICADCGQNRYTGRPCVNFAKEEIEEKYSNE